jgi:PAS domain S-box-containing protein
MTDATLFAALAADRRLAALADDARPAFVWSADGRRVLWSNGAGAALLGLALRDFVRDPAPLTTASLAPQIAAIIRGLARLGTTRLERLRFPGLARLEAIACACRRFEARDGTAGLLVTAMEVPRWLRKSPAIGKLADEASASPGPGPSEETPRSSGAWVWVANDAGHERQVEEPVPPPVRTTPLRFVFQTDAEGRFTSVSNELRVAIGEGADNWLGRGFTELARDLGIDPDRAITRAFASRDTWTGLTLNWRDDAVGATIPIEMSGLPTFDRERRFKGFRGFGICRPPVPLDAELASALDRVEDPSALEAEEPDASKVGPTEPTQPSRHKSSTALADTVLIPEDNEIEAVQARFEPANDRRGDRSIEPGKGEPRSIPAPVIDLSGAREARAPADLKVVRLHTKTAPDRPSLSASERTAFREIARALGARLEGDATKTPARSDEPRRRADEGARAEAAPALEEPAPDSPRTPAHVPEPAGKQDAPQPHVGGSLEADWIADGSSEATGGESSFENAGEDPPALEPRPLLPHPAANAADLPSAASDVKPRDTAMASLVDRLPIGVLVARGEDILFANRTLLDLLGYGVLDGLRQAGGMDRLFAGKGLASAADSEEACHGVLLTAADGETVAVDGRIQTIPWEGESALLISLRRPTPPDAGERLRAAERAATSAERRSSELQAVLDTATDGVIILDGEGCVVGINRSAEALFGYEAEEIAGKTMLLIFAPESHRAASDYLDSLKSNGVASLLNDGREVVGRVRQGGLVPLFMTIGRLGDAEGHRFCAVLRDMTSFKKAEDELVSARRQAEQASSQKSDFLAKIAHEIRTPLNAIIGFAEVMMEERFGPLGNDRYRAYLRDIHASGGHVISLVNDLLDLSKIEAGKLDLAFTSVSLNDVVQQSVAIMQPQANRDRIIIRTALAAALPNVVADGRSVRQVVLNLLSNSIKFTTPGGQVIVSTTMSEGGEAVLRVRDTGVGMTEQELAVAMEPFRQVSTSSLGGTGLGLPLTKALVEANRATFAIQSVKNAGTIVEVIFPATRVLAE